MQQLLEEDKDKWMGSIIILKVLRVSLNSALFDFTHPKNECRSTFTLQIWNGFCSDFGSAAKKVLLLNSLEMAQLFEPDASIR